jgi:alpha-tubulin suppressor-like RCC1 family protein
VKRPTPLPHLTATPLRDLVLAEKYGAAVDGKGDAWMWGVGYDPSGQLGRSLKGKVNYLGWPTLSTTADIAQKLKTLAAGPAKWIGLSKDGKLYAVAASRALQGERKDKEEQGWWGWLFGGDAGVDYVELKAAGGLKRGERWVFKCFPLRHSRVTDGYRWADVSAGRHHLLAVTTTGRTFSLPLSPSANSHRQLGTRQVLNALPSTSTAPASSSSSLITSSNSPESDPRFVTLLTEIPSLVGLPIAQVSTSDRTSFVRTTNGRVLGFGANEVGQIGLGASTAVEAVQTPVEVVLARGYPGGTSVQCLDVQAGAGTTFFVVERSSPGKEGSFVDLLACGSGLTGSLGNGLWSSASGNPVRVKT